MAIARCGNHTPDGTKYEYKAYALPVGHPDSGVVCGRVGCGDVARLWLTDDEANEHKGGARVFGIQTNSVKVRVSNELMSV
jgi:hypothetical protein